MSFNVSWIAIFGFLLASSEAFGWWAWTPFDTVDHSSQNAFVDGYQPIQPLPYSHKLHAGTRKIPCEYCHSAARRSASAGIPSMNTCMGCHKFVNTDADAIRFLTHKYENNEPIEWIKVHDLPDHVRFSHRVHKFAGLECQECHGPIEEMEVVHQHAPLQMGWCIGCHREKQASIECKTCHY